MRTSQGHPIMIATLESRTYADGLENITSKCCQLIIFNSLEDAEKTKLEILPQSLLEVSTKRYYLVVPNWVTGEEREAAQIVSANFRREFSENRNNTVPQ